MTGLTGVKLGETMSRLLIVVLSAALVAAFVGMQAGNTPAPAWSAPPAKDPPARDARLSDKPTTKPKGEADEPLGPEDDIRPYHFSRPITEDQEKEVLEYLQKKRPEIYQQVLADREKDQRRYKRVLRSMWPFISRIKSLPEKIQTAYETRQVTYVKMWRLARDIDAAKDAAAKKDLEKQLNELADQQFDADQIIREHRLSQLADQVKRLKEELADRSKDRSNVVREMVERLKKDAAHYGERRPGGDDRGQPATPPAGTFGAPKPPGGEGKGPPPPPPPPKAPPK